MNVSQNGLTFDSANVLVTGGLGFIGSNLCRRLVGMGANVHVVDSLIPEFGGNLFNIEGIPQDRLIINISDVRDPHSMKHLVRGKDVLFNLAGQTSHMDSMQDPQTDLEINCRAQLSILEACRHFNPEIKIVFASTRQIYGRPDYLPVTESHPIRPVDVNGINKVAGEWYHILYNNVYGLKACALRLTNTYGPRMRVKDARQTFVGVWIRQLLENGSIEVWGGNQRRDFTYIEDCVDALLLAAARNEVNGRVFNLGGPPPISLLELAEMLVHLNGSGQIAVRSFPGERLKIDIGDYYADYSSFSAAVGWFPKVALIDGLAETVQYYRQYLRHYI